MKEFKPGDRVVSLLSGYYLGVPGVIVGRSQVQYGNRIRYIVDLDCGQRIYLDSKNIEPLEKYRR
ncbi:hypothetical protein [Vagococcus xieshaowenii]|uniref:Uncharacterized protein n=1 Tax=Vagococcus xieshaowenii TaxID=2562451 RepID=A0AAJ5JLR3_9ENTE|nr:hypothetical protein E4031_05640 [Vagococcus xieshaowenii]